MITKKEYLEAQKVVDAYQEQLNKPDVSGCKFFLILALTSNDTYTGIPHELHINKSTAEAICADHNLRFDVKWTVMPMVVKSEKIY